MDLPSTELRLVGLLSPKPPIKSGFVQWMDLLCAFMPFVSHPGKSLVDLPDFDSILHLPELLRSSLSH